MGIRLAVTVLSIGVATLSSCASTDTPTASQELAKGTVMPESEAGNVVLYVSNQSYAISPVDIAVYLDDVLVLASEFEVGDQHNYIRYDYEWTPGPHVLRAVSNGRGVANETSIEVTEENWGFVGFWYNPDQGIEEHLQIIFQDERIYFR